MPTTIGNTKVYTTKEVQLATLYSYSTIRRKFQAGEIKHRQTAQGGYEVEHKNLVEFLTREQDIPPELADKIIDFRISNTNLSHNA